MHFIIWLLTLTIFHYELPTKDKEFTNNPKGRQEFNLEYSEDGEIEACLSDLPREQ